MERPGLCVASHPSMVILLSILTSAHVWAQTLVASAIKTGWMLTLVAVAVFSGCLTGCVIEFPAHTHQDAGASSQDAGLLPSPRALARGTYDAEGAAAWQQFSDLMLQSLAAATPNARTWAAIVFSDYVAKGDIYAILQEHNLTLKTVHAADPECSFMLTYDLNDGETMEDYEERRRLRFADLETTDTRCGGLRPANLRYYALAVEADVSSLLALRRSARVHRITPVPSGGGQMGIERPEWR